MRLIGLLLVFVAAVGAQPSADEFFERSVRPILAARCQACHNAKNLSGGLDLTTGSGDLKISRLLQAVSYLGPLKMPPTGKLPDREIATLRAWVESGAHWPSQAKAPLPKEFWSFRPLLSPALPLVKDRNWASSPVDRFILAELEARELTPSAPADKLILLRRATFDLTGLPPSAAEVAAFLGDRSAEAFARVVDRLLASPRYGEKWGRHWLDVARYADSTGADEDYRYPHAWRYRDYVINSFNADVPYNQFVREQIAGDLLPPPPGEAVNTAGIIATGFLALGPKLVAEQDKVKMFYDIVDEQIDVAGKAILGLTISCARCHDHKFDPVSTKDYYSLASIFASTKQLAKIEGTVSELYFAPLVAKPIADAYRAHQGRVAAKQGEINQVIAGEALRFQSAQAPQLAAYMMGTPVPNPSLDPAQLARWVAYLKPTKERRPHLDRFYKSPASAALYQAEFIAEADRRRRAAPGTKFLAGDNRFYTEVISAKGPLSLPEALRSETSRQQIAALTVELEAIKAGAPAEPPFACAVGEDQPVQQRVFLRGNPESKGDLVEKRFPTVLAGEKQPPILTGSGRLELGNWLADAANPLTARVMVNRIWQGHFGQGLVRTPNNFGLAGERPSHPALLDWLATRFIAEGWSVKKMHRVLMHSSTYQMNAAVTPLKREKDPDNRLLSRFPIRRKAVEEIRDSLLLLDGSLDLTMGGSLQSGVGTDNEFSDGRKSIHPDASTRRTVYLSLRRSNLATLFTLFDFGDATTSTETRSETNVAPQALYMMNSKFVADRAATLGASAGTSEDKVRHAYQAILGQPATVAQVSDALKYLSNFPGPTSLAWTSYCRTLIASNDFLYVY
ncbi:MAG: DUF1549 and DUF1553 domain-containing protein [Acidobacteria bacterium]|nr:DUF1549 and DUF1553 domain-containing protein [Acidobacteriota bacterium]